MKVSEALSLLAHPGDGSIATRKVAIVIANGVDAAAVEKIRGALEKAGASGRLVGPRVGPIEGAGGKMLEAEASLENEPSVLFDGLVLPGGSDFEALAANGLMKEYIRDTYRHGKTILALGTGVDILEAVGIPLDDDDPGVLAHRKPGADDAAELIEALARHRHPERESDPPRV